MLNASTAMWIAAGTGVVALIAVVWVCVQAWQAFTRVNETRYAAMALLDAHTARLADTAAAVGMSAQNVTEGGEELAAQVAELRADAEQLRWLLSRVPEARESLRRELLDLFLPTTSKDSSDD